jgi:uracil-DNA glycosylase
MAHAYDPGYGAEPFRTLCNEHPGEDVYPANDFRVEWGPIFHRGRLDGTARVLVIGQDPAAHETVVRRVLVGEAGRRVQGFLAKLGVSRSYVIVNAFLYSVYGQQGGEAHKNDAKIIAYRNRWFDALLGAGSKVEAVVAFGNLADGAWTKWRATPAGAANAAAFAKVPHPTSPDSGSHHDEVERLKLTKAMLQKWNAALTTLGSAVAHPDANVTLVPYGDDFGPGERPEIPEFDMPPGLPAWMRLEDGWAARTGATAAAKRATLTVTVPPASLPPP